MLRFNLRELIFQNYPGGIATPDPLGLGMLKHACMAILHTAASLSVLQCPTTNGELQPPLYTDIRITILLSVCLTTVKIRT